jgi:hypothetical protein
MVSDGITMPKWAMAVWDMQMIANAIAGATVGKEIRMIYLQILFYVI